MKESKIEKNIRKEIEKLEELAVKYGVKLEDIKTELIAYPCPVCGKYYLPYMHSKDGYAFMVCPEHGQFKTSVAVSVNFRRFCSKVGSQPNRNPTYYTSSEERVRRFLLNRGLIEGLDFMHNARIGPIINGNGKKTYYWADFVIPSKRLVIEASPKIWHKMWGRQKADIRKEQFLSSKGWEIIHLDEKDLQQLNKRRKKSKYPKSERVLRLYKIFNCEEEYSLSNGKT